MGPPAKHHTSTTTKESDPMNFAAADRDIGTAESLATTITGGAGD